MTVGILKESPQERGRKPSSMLCTFSAMDFIALKESPQERGRKQGVTPRNKGGNINRKKVPKKGDENHKTHHRFLLSRTIERKSPRKGTKTNNPFYVTNVPTWIERKSPRKGTKTTSHGIAYRADFTSHWKKVPKKGDENVTPSCSPTLIGLLKESPQERGRKLHGTPRVPHR